MSLAIQNSGVPQIEALNELLRGEISAVESYDQALERLADDAALRADLQSCRASHAERVQRLRATIVQLGGKPSETSGPWGAFVKMAEGAARALGKKAALAMLEEGEEHGLKEYHQNLDKLVGDTRMLVASELLPAQRRTHEAVSAIHDTMA